MYRLTITESNGQSLVDYFDDREELDATLINMAESGQKVSLDMGKFRANMFEVHEHICAWRT